MMIRKTYILLALLLMPVLAWTAATDDFDPNRWNSETMINATIMIDGESTDALTLCAYIDGELRGYQSQPVKVGESWIYMLRVKGDIEDTGSEIELSVFNGLTDEEYSGDRLTIDQTLAWNGETIGLPSNPVVITVNGVVKAESIETVEGFEFERESYDNRYPLELAELYTVLPDEAIDKCVVMEFAAGSEAKGIVEQRFDEWVFVPASDCKGDVDIVISLASDPSISAVLHMVCHVSPYAIVIDSNLPTVFQKGDEVSLTPYYKVIPEDADDREVKIEVDDSDVLVLSFAADGTCTMHAQGIGSAVVTISLVNYPEISATLTFDVQCEMESVELTISATEDDILDSSTGEPMTRRYIVWGERELVLTPKPIGCYFDISRLEYQVEFDGNVPYKWSAYDFDEEGYTDDEINYSFTPKLPGTYIVKFSYDGEPLVATEPIKVLVKTNLGEGWNWIGLSAKSDGTTISGALSDPNYLVEARTQTHFLINDPVLGYYGGFTDSKGEYTNDFTLDAAKDGGHFRVKLNADDTIYTDGAYDLSEGVWHLNAGWTWVNNPLFCDIPLSRMKSMAYEFEQGDVIKSSLGMATFTENGWSGSLKTLAAGQGYSVRSAHAHDVKLFTYDFEQSVGSRSNVVAHRYIDNMGIIADLRDTRCMARSGIDMIDPMRYTIMAFVGDECRGEGVYDDGRWFITVDGQAGDRVNIKVKDMYTGKVIDCANEFDFAPMIGTFTEPAMIDAPGLDALDDINSDCTMVYVSVATIVGADRIYDMQGRDVTAANGALIPGTYIAVANGSTCKAVVK